MICMMWHSTSSASLLMSQTWEEWLTHQRALYRLEKWNFMKFKKENAKYCTWGGTTPCTSKYWAMYSAGVYPLLEGSLSENNLWVLGGTKLSISQHVLAAKNANGVPCSIRQRAACCLREVILLLHSALLRPRLECCVLFWSPQCKRAVEFWTESDTGPQTYLRDRSIPLLRKGWAA